MPGPGRTVDSSIDAAISRKVRRAKPGTVFTPALFASMGGRAAVDKALQRLGRSLNAAHCWRT